MLRVTILCVIVDIFDVTNTRCSVARQRQLLRNLEEHKGPRHLLLRVMAARTRGAMGNLPTPLWNLKNVDFSGVTRILGVGGHNGAKAFPARGHRRPREGAMGHLPPLWNLQNVDFSGVARITGLEGHKGPNVFHVGGHGRPHEGAMGHLPTPSGI